MKWGPTSANGNPTRFVFLRSSEAKEKLRPFLAPGNIEKTMAAPVTVIVAYDLLFYEKLPKLFPQSPGMRNLFARESTTCRGHSQAQLVASRGIPHDRGAGTRARLRPDVRF